MFNIKSATYNGCDNHGDDKVYMGDHSYIQPVKWSNFINNVNYYLNKSLGLNDKISEYKILKIV